MLLAVVSLTGGYLIKHLKLSDHRRILFDVKINYRAQEKCRQPKATDSAEHRTSASEHADIKTTNISLLNDIQIVYSGACRL